MNNKIENEKEEKSLSSVFTTIFAPIKSNRQKFHSPQIKSVGNFF